MPRRYRILLCALPWLLTAIPAVVCAQVENPEPTRPTLPAEADSNDANVYYVLGLANLEARPEIAADAFYWASRLAPHWAHPLYARRVALMMTDSRRLLRYMDGHKKTLRSPKILRIDSLELRALHRDPFFYRNLDNKLLMLYVTEATIKRMKRTYSFGSVEQNRELIEHEIQREIEGKRSVQWRAWRAYSNLRFHEALEHYATVMERADDKSDLYLQRARIFYLVQQYDSAHAQLSQALEEYRAQDEDELVVVYESKAILEYCVGLVREAEGNLQAAREAYGRALMEDLAFYPAHLRLGVVAINAGDTTAALSEFHLATAIDPGDAVPHITYGKALLVSGQYEDGVAQLERAVALEPYYADIYYLLALGNEALGDFAAAAHYYAAFLERTVESDERREPVAKRIAALEPPS